MKNVMCVLLTLILLSLSGCGSAVTKSRTAVFKPSDSSNSKWKFQATADTGSFGSAIVIAINKKEVIKGDLDIMSGIGHFSGTYEGKTIDAECSLDQRGISMFNRCTIFIDSEKFTDLTF